MKSTTNLDGLIEKDEYFYVSASGLDSIRKNFDPKCPRKNIIWTTDYSTELPIVVKKTGPGSETPFTLIDLFNGAASKFNNKIVVTWKKYQKWYVWTFN